MVARPALVDGLAPDLGGRHTHDLGERLIAPEVAPLGVLEEDGSWDGGEQGLREPEVALDLGMGPGHLRLRQLSFVDVLVDAMQLHRAALGVLLDAKPHGDPARLAAHAQDASLEPDLEPRVRRFDPLADHLGDRVGVLRMDPLRRELPDAHDVAAGLLGCQAVESVVLVVEGEVLALDVVLPGAHVGDREGSREQSLAAAELLLLAGRGRWVGLDRLLRHRPPPLGRRGDVHQVYGTRQEPAGASRVTEEGTIPARSSP